MKKEFAVVFLNAHTYNIHSMAGQIKPKFPLSKQNMYKKFISHINAIILLIRTHMNVPTPHITLYCNWVSNQFMCDSQ